MRRHLMAGGLAAGLVLLLSAPQSRAEQDIVLGLSVAMSGPMTRMTTTAPKRPRCLSTT